MDMCEVDVGVRFKGLLLDEFGTVYLFTLIAALK
jgi:hypothetical protein